MICSRPMNGHGTLCESEWGEPGLEKIIKNTSTFSSFTLLSRLIGLLRDVLRSFAFGTGPLAVAFDIAFRIPSMFRSLFAEGAMAQALLPVYENYKNKKSAFQALRSLNTFVLLFLTLFSVAAWFVLPQFIPHLMNDPEMREPNTELTLRLSQILFPYLLFVSLSAVYTTVQYSHNIFWSGAFGPALVNVFVVALFGFYLWAGREAGEKISEKDVYIFSGIVLSSSLVHFVFQGWVLKKNRLYFGFSSLIFHPIVKNLFVLMLPAIFGAAVQHINLLVDIYLATSLDVDGAVSALTYAQRLIQFPMGVFAVAVSIAAMPVLTQQFAREDKKNFVHDLLISVRLSLFLMLPASLGLLVYAEEIVALVFERGEFDQESTAITSFALKYYAAGVAAFGVQKLLVSAFYARRQTKQPATIALVILFLNVAFSLLLMPHLKHGGLALGSSLAVYAGVVIYLVLIHKKISLKGAPTGYYKSLLKLILANLLLLLVLIIMKYVLPLYLTADLGYVSSSPRVWPLFVDILLAVSFYFSFTLWLKLDEPRKIKQIFRRGYRD